MAYCRVLNFVKTGKYELLSALIYSLHKKFSNSCQSLFCDFCAFCVRQATSRLLREKGNECE